MEVYTTEVEGIGISLIMTGYGKPLIEQQRKEMQSMVDSFRDYGYYNLIDLSPPEEDSVDYDSSNLRTVLSVVAIAAVVVGGIALKIVLDNPPVVHGLRKKVRSAVKSLNLGSWETEKKQELKLFKEADRPRQQQAARPGGRVSVKKTKTADESYIECMHTLYKSGLLTRKQLDEILEKHKKRS